MLVCRQVCLSAQRALDPLVRQRREGFSLSDVVGEDCLHPTHGCTAATRAPPSVAASMRIEAPVCLERLFSDHMGSDLLVIAFHLLGSLCSELRAQVPCVRSRMHMPIAHASRCSDSVCNSVHGVDYIAQILSHAIDHAASQRTASRASVLPPAPLPSPLHSENEHVGGRSTRCYGFVRCTPPSFSFTPLPAFSQPLPASSCLFLPLPTFHNTSPRQPTPPHASHVCLHALSPCPSPPSNRCEPPTTATPLGRAPCTERCSPSAG